MTEISPQPNRPPMAPPPCYPPAGLHASGSWRGARLRRLRDAAAKARGVKLGNPRPETARFRRSRSCGRGRCEGCGGGAAVGRDLAGLSANAAAQELNRRGVQTPRGGSWTARSVLNRRPSRASGRPSGHLAPVHRRPRHRARSPCWLLSGGCWLALAGSPAGSSSSSA